MAQKQVNKCGPILFLGHTQPSSGLPPGMLGGAHRMLGLKPQVGRAQGRGPPHWTTAPAPRPYLSIPHPKCHEDRIYKDGENQLIALQFIRLFESILYLEFVA